jgi:ATP-dependent protease ClpP protease subunit
MARKAKIPRAGGKRPSKALAPKALATTKMPAPIRDRLPKIVDASEGLPRPVDVHFTVKAASADMTEIDIYDVIGGYGVNAANFRATLKAVKTKNIRVRINSPGGYVFDGIAMYNDMLAFRRNGGHIGVEVTGLAASAASILAMGGDTIQVAHNAFIMIHNAWVGIAGDRNELAKASSVLERVDAALARTYAERSGMSVDEIAEMMDDETWMDGDKAVELGFADESVRSDVKASTRFDLSAYFNVPSVLKNSAKGTVENVETQTAAPDAQAVEDLSRFNAAVEQLTATLKGLFHATESSAPAATAPA